MKSAILLAAVASIILSGCSSPEIGSDQDAPHVAVSADYNSSGGNAFLPKSVSVPSGATVTWTMDNGEPHTVDFAEPQGQAVNGISQTFSGNLDPGEAYEVTFSTPGVYDYYCLYHSSVQNGERVGMVGTVTVQ